MGNWDPEVLRAARKARIEARKARTTAQEDENKDDAEGSDDEDKDDAEGQEEEPKEVESAFNYNPLFSKPTNMGADKPRGGYHYYGPPPDAGTSYGLYKTKAGAGMIAPQAEGQEVKDPTSGKSAKLEGPADKDAVAAILAAASEMVTLPPCPSCKKVSVTSAAVYSKAVASFYCPSCGDDMTRAVASAKAGQSAEAVQYEALSDVNQLGDVAEADVNMTLFDEGGANPYWNIDIKGMPVARVFLKDQPKPDEARAVFTSAQYYQGVAGAIAKLGAAPILKQIGAKLWTNKIDESVKVKALREQVKAEIEKSHAATVKGWSDKLLSCVALVCAGMDKNFFKEDGNRLKEALYASFRKHGIGPQVIMAAIEDGFSEGSTAYFQSVLDRAIAYMGMSDVARAEIEKAIGDANVVMPQGPADAEGSDLPVVDPAGMNAGDPSDESTLAARLVRSSVAVSSVGASQGFGSAKEDLKSRIGLGGAGPRTRR